MGCIDLPAVLEPLQFVLPPREVLQPVPDVDIASELGSLTFETQLKEPVSDPDVTVEAGRPDPASTRSGLIDSEPSAELTELKSEERDEESLQDEDFSLE